MGVEGRERVWTAVAVGSGGLVILAAVALLFEGGEPARAIAPEPVALAPVARASEVLAAVEREPVDRDEDRPFVSRDRCPEAQEDLDGFEDEDGCPDLDNDQDGVDDAEDGCPGASEDRNGINDRDGCPELLGQSGPLTRVGAASGVGEARRGFRFPRRRVDLELHRADVRDVLRLIAREAGVNIVYGGEVQGAVTASLRGALLEDIFVAVLRATGHGFEVTGGIVLVERPERR